MARNSPCWIVGWHPNFIICRRASWALRMVPQNFPRLFQTCNHTSTVSKLVLVSKQPRIPKKLSCGDGQTHENKNYLYHSELFLSLVKKNNYSKKNFSASIRYYIQLKEPSCRCGGKQQKEGPAKVPHVFFRCMLRNIRAPKHRDQGR